MALDDADAVETELQLMTLNEVFVYRIPALQGSAGHRANDWDLEKPALTGQLKVFSSGDKLTYVRIYHKNADGQSKMFAECPVRVDRSDPERPQAKLEYFFQSVTDSSRYFVLRMEDRKSGKHMYLGIGFAQRQDAFDLRAALDDQMRRLSRFGDSSTGGSGQTDSNGVSGVAKKDAGLNRKLDDMTLKEGQKIKLNLNLGGRGNGGASRARAQDTGNGGGAVPLLAGPMSLKPPVSVPPPSTTSVPAPLSVDPPAATAIATPTAPSADILGDMCPLSSTVAASASTGGDDDNDDDWGDFQ